MLCLGVLAVAATVPLLWVVLAGNATPGALPESPVPGLRARSVLIASLNLAKVTDADAMAREIEAHAPLRDADVFFFQEVARDSGESAAEALSHALRRQAVFASPEAGVAATVGGIAILSRLPLKDATSGPLEAQNLVFRSRRRIYLAATVDTPAGPVRVITTHLDTRINPAARVRQLEPALDQARAGLPAVIGGDFNTNDMEWVFNVVPTPLPGWQASRVRALMASRGFQTPFTVRRATFDHLGMQLDWLYANPGLRAVAAGIVPMEFSDHHAVWAQFTAQD